MFEEEQSHELPARDSGSVLRRAETRACLLHKAMGSFLRGWQMDILEGHPSGVDVRIFMQKWNPESMISSRKRSWLSMEK